MAAIVNISGTGSDLYCYATVNGTKYISSAQNITLTSNKIVFGVYGDSADPGKLTIDGEVLLSAKNDATETYTWAVPDNVTAVDIVLDETDYESYVTVTTSSGGGSGGGDSGGSSGYTVNLTGSMNSSYGYATINGTKITTTGTTTYTTKPTISVYVGASYFGSGNCKVTLNGTTVKSGSGSYTVDIGEADTINIKFNTGGSGVSQYYTCDITTEVSVPPDPMAPHDGHNTNIGQVARQIEGGTVLSGGVGRKIESGLVLVGGVSREISIIKPLTIDITVTGDDSDGDGACWLTIDGVKYTTAQTVEVKAGTEVTFYSKSQANSAHSITLNGATVASSSSAGTIDYTMVVEQNLSVTLSVSIDTRNDRTKGYVTITTV